MQNKSGVGDLDGSSDHGSDSSFKTSQVDCLSSKPHFVRDSTDLELALESSGFLIAEQLRGERTVEQEKRSWQYRKLRAFC